MNHQLFRRMKIKCKLFINSSIFIVDATTAPPVEHGLRAGAAAVAEVVPGVHAVAGAGVGVVGPVAGLPPHTHPRLGARAPVLKILQSLVENIY